MVKIVSRKSDLAIIQAEYVAKELRKINKNIDITFIKKETQGDIDQLTNIVVKFKFDLCSVLCKI